VKDGLLVIIGGLVTIAVAVMIELLRRPKLVISIALPEDFPSPLVPQGMRSLKLLVSNKPLPWIASWMLRGAALQVRASIVFRHLDGQQVFGSRRLNTGGSSPCCNVAHS
jgi:hypothetical protein